MPGVTVEGVGAMADPVPPVATVYHLNVLPAAGVAVTAIGVTFWQ